MTLSSSPSHANSWWISARMASVGDTRAATGVGLLRELSALRGNLRPLHVYTGVLTPPPPAMLALAVWMIVCVHRQLHSRGGRWLLYPVIAMLALASIGGGYETLREAADAKAYPMPGQLIDVGGHSLHLSCTGSGTPTVVLEPGGGGMSSILGWIAPAVARDTRV